MIIEAAPWKKGDIIRNTKTGKPLLVIHVYINQATMLADPTQPSPQLPVLLLRRDYDQYAPDADMECKIEENLMNTKSSIIGWEFKPCSSL